MANLEGTIALVTGASRGAGKGIALVLGEHGATVYITGRSFQYAFAEKGSTAAKKDAKRDRRMAQREREQASR